MAIVKIEVSIPELRKSLNLFKQNRIKALTQLSNDITDSVSNTLNILLNAEMSLFLGEDDQKDNKRNGYLPERTYALKGVGSIRVKIPVDRKGSFKSKIIPKHERIDPRLQEDIAILHLAGLSTRTLAMMSQRLLGVEVNKDTVTDSLGAIQGQAEKWLTRPISKKYWALYIDGTNFRIQRKGSVSKEPSLVVMGIDEDNYKSILAIEPGTRDSSECWRTVFSELKKRGLAVKSVRIGIMDGLPGLEKVFKEEFTNSVTARCWWHAMQNIMNKVSKRNSEKFKTLVHKIMYASSEDDARSSFNNLKLEMLNEENRAVKCIERDLDSLLAHYRFNKEFWVALRTTNSIERINKELKRRYKSMEKIGVKNLTCLLAFTALRLEMGWRRLPVNAIKYQNLKYTKQNKIEKTIAELKIIQ